MTKAQTRALAELSPRYLIEYQDSLVDFNDYFATKAPLIVEIGFGMGEGLLETAAKHPEYNFLGIEVHEPGVGSLMHGLAEQELDNVRIINYDAVLVLKNMLANESVTRLRLYFPDPWPKKRHHKRRIVQPDWVSLVTDKLVTDGQLCLATDWENYAEHMLLVLEGEPRLENTVGSGYAPRPLDRPLTRFEQRGIRVRAWRLGFDIQ